MDHSPSNSPSSGNAPPPTILVVDDEPSIAGLCRAFLQQEGFHVLDADGSSAALKICTRHEGPIDLLLTDLVLPPPGFHLASSDNEFPHVHGHELALRAARIRPGLRIILMSGNPDKQLTSHGINRGTLPFLQKPFTRSALLELIQNVLRNPPPTLNVHRTDVANEVDWFD